MRPPSASEQGASTNQGESAEHLLVLLIIANSFWSWAGLGCCARRRRLKVGLVHGVLVPRPPLFCRRLLRELVVLLPPPLCAPRSPGRMATV